MKGYTKFSNLDLGTKCTVFICTYLKSKLQILFHQIIEFGGISFEVLENIYFF